MAPPWGFSFRLTDPYVTDTGVNGFVGTAVYPTVAENGATCGWVDNYFVNAADQDAGVNERFAGRCRGTSTATASVFRVLLPSAADYLIRLALGDRNYGVQCYTKILDTTTLLATIDAGATSAGGNYFDATGVQRTLAAWVTDNVAITHTFATTQFNLSIGGGGGAKVGNVAHLWIDQVVVGGGGSGFRCHS